MTEKQITYFSSVYKHGSITKAAEDMIVSRPVISRAISEVEQEIGVRLFDRKSNGVIPTEPCVILYNMLDCFGKTYDLTIEKLRNLSFLNESRSLRIGMLDASSGWFYPMVYRPFHNEYPNITISVEGILSEDSSRLLNEGVLDLAIGPLSRRPSVLLGSLYLYTTQWVLCSPKTDPCTAAAEATAAMISELQIAILETLPHSFYESKNVVLTTHDSETVRIAVAGGYAHSVLPLELCGNWADVVVRPFVPSSAPEIYLLWNEATPHSPVFDTFMAFIKNVDFEPLRKTRGIFRP